MSPTLEKFFGIAARKNNAYTEYCASQKREKELQIIKSNIQKMLRLQESEHEAEHIKAGQEL